MGGAEVGGGGGGGGGEGEMGEGRERLVVGRDKETRKRRWGGSSCCMILQRWWCSLCAVFPPKLTEKGEREKR